MNDLSPFDPDSMPEPDSTPPPAKLFLGSPSRPAVSLDTFRPKQPIPEPEPPFWTNDWFKVIVFLLVAGSAGGWAYYHFFWLNRLPQERDLTDLQGKSIHVNIIGHDDSLLMYTTPGSETARYLSIATLSPSDQQFIAKLDETPLAKLPFACTLTDSAGKETAVRLLAHNDDWAQYAQIADGSTHYVFLATLIPSDQAVIRLLPADLDFRYPLDYVFTGAPEPGAKVQILGRSDDTVEYLELATGKTLFTAIADLSSTDQSLVRELPPSLMDKPSAPTDSASAKLAKSTAASNASINANLLKSLVIIKGDSSAGSGFIVKMHDQYFVMTNEHILSGNKELTITDLDGNKFPTNGFLYGAIGYDVAILKIPDSLGKNHLEIMADPQNNAKIGDAITVPGNSLGTGVPTEINGQLRAIGPELVEVSASLVRGISGSPIFDHPSGQVIGIATMSVTYKIADDNSGILTDTRWSGYRVDNIDPDKGWVKMDWARFRDEGQKIRAAIDLDLSLDAVLRGKAPAEISNPLVQTMIGDFQSDITTAVAHKNKEDIESAFHTFNSKLRSLADNSTSDLTRDTLYPYHANIAKELDDLRKYMDQAFADDSRNFDKLVGNVR